MSRLSGIAASNGIAIAKAFRLEHPDLTVDKKNVADPQAEIERFGSAVDESIAELEVIKKRTAEQISEKEADIFGAHLLVLQDPELIGPITDKIKTDSVNAEFALHETSTMFVDMFEAMDNEYMKERAADVRDVTKRVLAHLLGVKIQNPSLITDEVVIIAEDLTPSDTVQLNPQYIKGFITDIGGRTSHSAILARTLEIPAVVGAKSAMSSIQNGTIVIIDGLEGEILLDPDEATLAEYKEKQTAFADQKAEWAKLKNEATLTKDGVAVELGANIGTPKDLTGVLENGGEAIGLYRTEFLYMGRDNFPTEQEQFDAYSAVLKGMEGKPTVVRTLDIGGDKELSYLKLPKELNPFLGLRAIRLCLEMPDMFRTQLRALLRASVHGNLKIMFPMIATLDEFREAKALLLEEKAKLESEGVEVSDSIEVGIMVEIPSTAVMADTFAKEVDFFSIGTNDLIQYTMAADRMNESVSYLYQPYNPAILRLVKTVIDASHKEGKWTGMCGEMAGDEIAIPILLGLGLDEFSMSASSILKARSQLSRLSKADMEGHTEHILGLATSQEVEDYVKNL
ncbi:MULTISPECIES: phosphoenolpyruvate--protein phosphotransferase [unclassified Planococcus (in: firmicutes)]|uniref:phosphoenolpyruvate--protein phosphotransferase n=1 Tax=Planococcus TaxID=1372 RepID=UPI000C31D094|nr:MULTISPECIES: phosphoenolpyruvate--protein phosphotransferase [unclassified Planococcus (in: firmicutes)]AUD14463.1 phosphoenolpyruvate--protein phosphotransferase [Planococcus sp. MB-3u-03]PKG44739.1 phosphoenolpyruvate--protein phosphotransferase [Planococcus sp. Urea-trap-24]PKG87082.1 phosphoenolpyruvate--protein phosphotransferase [Planococcus sp. Urea-3u-39]PKH41137.1 phosphoenolpyruvate--protein phosphotransferase [Planococcus sp. MB-3u-09]